VQFRFETDRECRDVFQSIKDLTVVKGGVEKLYAFFYQPVAAEKRCNGWAVYDPLKEYQRMGVGTDRCQGWRVSNINKDYSVNLTLHGCVDASLTGVAVFSDISFDDCCSGDY
jgi:myotubularin-related protein 6/7/8